MESTLRNALPHTRIESNVIENCSKTILYHDLIIEKFDRCNFLYEIILTWLCKIGTVLH